VKYNMAVFPLLLLAFSLQTSLVSAETGLADDFIPSVNVQCVGSTMTIRVDTVQPFYGVVHGINRSEPGCSVLGQGGRKTKLTIDLSIPEGAPGSCGVKYNPVTDERKVSIAVRPHNQIELIEDSYYVVACGKAGFENSREEVSVVQLKIVDNYNVKKLAVLEGSQYTMSAQVLNHDPSFGILVKTCIAFDNSDSSVVLIDDRGCRTSKLLSDFTYDDDAGTAEATVFSMFRMGNSNRTYFQCDVEICRGQCSKPTCSLDQAEINRRLGQGQSELNSVDVFARSRSNGTITTSTSVFVAEPGSAAAIGAGACLGGDLNPTWLTYLCIAFGVLFGIMLLINIFLCSAMTCSCTRTEVIEKEPSIYDDYSLYDSQYGYASKAYSGSDYDGSEYDGGTLHRSEYSGHRRHSPHTSHHGSRYLDH